MGSGETFNKEDVRAPCELPVSLLQALGASDLVVQEQGPGPAHWVVFVSFYWELTYRSAPIASVQLCKLPQSEHIWVVSTPSKKLSTA